MQFLLIIALGLLSRIVSASPMPTNGEKRDDDSYDKIYEAAEENYPGVWWHSARRTCSEEQFTAIYEATSSVIGLINGMLEGVYGDEDVGLSPAWNKFFMDGKIWQAVWRSEPHSSAILTVDISNTQRSFRLCLVWSRLFVTILSAERANSSIQVFITRPSSLLRMDALRRRIKPNDNIDLPMSVETKLCTTLARRSPKRRSPLPAHPLLLLNTYTERPMSPDFQQRWKTVSDAFQSHSATHFSNRNRLWRLLMEPTGKKKTWTIPGSSPRNTASFTNGCMLTWWDKIGTVRFLHL